MRTGRSSGRPATGSTATRRGTTAATRATDRRPAPVISTMPRLRTFAAPIAATALALAGCGSSTAPRAAGPTTRPARPAVSAFQTAILRDGHVTYAEYRRSVMATVDCLRRAPGHIRIFG